MQKQFHALSLNLIVIFYSLPLIGVFGGSPCGSEGLVYTHKTHGYEIVLKYGDIEKQRASAVINPYAPGQELAHVSEALYKSGGRKLLGRLRNFHVGNKKRFEMLSQEPGNYLLLPSYTMPLSCKLAFSNMVLMNIPLAIDANDDANVVQALCRKLHSLFDELSTRFKMVSAKATVVIPALGHDPLFKGYKGEQVAERFLAATVSTLMFLHINGNINLNRVVFVVDNKEALEDYQAAFKKYFEQKGDRFSASGQASPEVG